MLYYHTIYLFLPLSYSGRRSPECRRTPRIQASKHNQIIQHRFPPPPRLSTTAPLCTSLHLYCVCSIPRGLTANNLAEADLIECTTTAQSISVYPLATVGDNLQSVDEPPAFKHRSFTSPNKQTKHTNRFYSNFIHEQTNKQTNEKEVFGRAQMMIMIKQASLLVGGRVSWQIRSKDSHWMW